jgi:hypothetical protein
MKLNSRFICYKAESQFSLLLQISISLVFLLKDSRSLSIDYESNSQKLDTNFKQIQAPAAFVTSAPSETTPYSALFIKQSSPSPPPIFHVDGTIGPKGNGDCEDPANCHEEYKIFYGGIRSKLRGIPGQRVWILKIFPLFKII